MKSFSRAIPVLAIGAWLFTTPAAQAYTCHLWNVASPNHEQTFAYGSEQHRVWAERGRDRHLAVLLDFTNDPYVDSDNPRQYDNFTFSFPGVTLGKDGHTFYYRTPDGRSIPVAAKRPDFFGINEIHLLPNAFLIVDKPHGYLTLTLVIEG
ncbi:MAG TPA: hypothetical protein VGZ93_09565 [Candidatus Methylacidiphilales bacterium]|jgi:hypothetical protein|nr:hypothetical protein [Candidatus Methylacidiphilales bacterium]